jgi:hypothetical protein
VTAIPDEFYQSRDRTAELIDRHWAGGAVTLIRALRTSLRRPVAFFLHVAFFLLAAGDLTPVSGLPIRGQATTLKPAAAGVRRA